jgi:hypothetical protein
MIVATEIDQEFVLLSTARLEIAPRLTENASTTYYYCICLIMTQY